MFIELLRPCSNPEAAGKPGDEINVSDSLGDQLIAAGVARLAGTIQPIRDPIVDETIEAAKNPGDETALDDDLGG